MATIDEPAYMLAARSNTRDRVPTSSTIVRKLLERIHSLEAENSRLTTELDKVWDRIAY